ncbi:endonuclease domain-containing protein [Rhodanobacter sp. FDAARGOS 1247]|uniref:endonuclease domain-containing protein n=1 Tax=Rhodanobacter sp. FDAARGOS 1247 TaxID=2778082 RepID=UPI00194F1E7F|nr:endonuclease domain-containing protein [Rhodanobacter sp. FDAARGOS 1247]QRP64715.1 endonuclease domain-containing protein [Rhodanobacter sp. FDAARGOS 1247]
MRHKPPLPTRTLTTAKLLRTASTDAELKLWYHLRAKRLAGLKFRRQHPIPPYIADFFCEELRLVVEIDGSQHDEETDSIRTRALERRGLVVLRFWDNQVLQETEAVLEAILNFARGRTLSPPPLPQGEGP